MLSVLSVLLSPAPLLTQWVLLVLASLGLTSAAQPLAPLASTPLVLVVHDLQAQPQVGVAFTVVDAFDQPQMLTTDADGVAATTTTGTVMTIQQATAADGSPLRVDANRADGSFVVPLTAGEPLTLTFTLEGRLLFRIPGALDDPAFGATPVPFPTLAVVQANGDVRLALPPTSTDAARISVQPADPQTAPRVDPDPARHTPWTLILVGSVLGGTVLLFGLVTWLRSRAGAVGDAQ